MKQFFSRLLAASLAFGLPMMLAADTLTCTPKQGGQEAEIVIEGQDFGLKKGKVTLGGEPCLVKKWTATSITARTPRKLKALGAKYDMQVIEKSGEVSDLPQAFELIAMVLDEVPFTPDDYVDLPYGLLHYVAGSNGKRGRTFTLEGDGFGGKKGKVFVSGPDGKEKACSILDWDDDSIECLIPKGMENNDSLSVRVVNSLGSFSHENLVKMDRPAQLLGEAQSWRSSVYASGDCHEISYQGHSIMFYAGWRDEWAHFEVDFNGVRQIYYSDLQNRTQSLWMTGLWPVIMDGRLYLFFNKGGNLNCLQLDGGCNVANPDSYIWRQCSLPADFSLTSGDFVPVYDQQKHLLYVFANANNYLYVRTAEITPYFHRSRILNQWKYSRMAYARWHSGGSSSVLQLSDLVYGPAACMAFNPKVNATRPLVAWRQKNELWYGFFEDDQSNSSIVDTFAKINDLNDNQPFLISCGDGSAAMTYKASGFSFLSLRIYGYYPENQQAGKDLFQKINFPFVFPVALDRPPRLSVSMRKDGNNNFHMIMWSYFATGSYVYGRSITDLGTVTPQAPGDIVDWATLSHKDPVEWLWDCPVLGVIDGGPPLCNSTDPKNDKKGELLFTDSSSQSRIWELNGKAGIFVSVDPPVLPGPCGEFHAGISSAYSQEITKTIGVELAFASSPEDNDSVWVLFLVPQTRCTKFNYQTAWGNLDYRNFRNFLTTQVNVEGVSIQPQRFPRSYFTSSYFPSRRTYGDLTSYSVPPKQDDPCGYLNLGQSTRWGTGATAKLRMTQLVGESISAGFYLNFKVGVGIADVATAGIEGEFAMNSTIKKTKETSVNATILNNDAETAGQVKSASYKAYWFGTKDKAPGDCYWMPQKRLGCGDQPFFVTYSVNDIDYKK